MNITSSRRFDSLSYQLELTQPRPSFLRFHLQIFFMNGEPMNLVMPSICDDDAVLTLRSSEGNLFKIGQARAFQSEVWKKMLQVNGAGNGKKRKAGPAFGAGDGIEVKNEELEVVELEEEEKICTIFLESLQHDDWVKRSLTPKQVVKLLRMADKFQALMPALFIPCMVEIVPVKWDLEDVLLIYHYSDLLNLQTLRNVAARNFVRLGDTIDHPIQQAKVRVAAHHLLDLHLFRKRWIDYSEVMFTRLENCTQNKKCKDLWSSNKVVEKDKLCSLHQALKNEKRVLDSFTL